jgi:acetolactate synthase-1/2/3 large subunit
MNVAQYIAEFLVEKNVRHVFGYQGGAVTKIIDEIVTTGAISYIQNYHEQASAFCADAYSRVTGNMGVALATSGPGATNLITGIANAQMDSIPTLFITGQDYLANITKDNGARQNGFQDLDIVSIVKPITKYAAMLVDENRIRYELEKAWWSAKTGRPGSVLLDIPIDVQFKTIDPEKLEGFAPDKAVDEKSETAALIDAIENAKRPIMLLGGGVRVSGAQDDVRAFAAKTNIPVVATLNGLDIVEGTYGFAGLHGNTFANLAVQNADLLLAFGVRFGQRQVGKTPHTYTKARVVHVDIDERELKRIFPDELAIQSDLKKFLCQLNADIKEQSFSTYAAWHEKIKGWVALYRSNAYLNKEGVDPVRAVEQLSAFFAPQAIVTSDVGQNQMWVAQAFQVKGQQRFLNSCGLGSMGYSLPAAIGAKIAFPDKQVIAFTGDGGLQMNLQEFMLIGQRQLGIKCVVLNNDTLGMMREVQARYYNAHYYGANREDFACVDLEKLSRAYGIGYRKVGALEDVVKLQECLWDDNPYIIDVAVAFDSLLSNRYDEAACFEKERIDD